MVSRWELQPKFNRAEWEPYSIEQILLARLSLNHQVGNLYKDLCDGVAVTKLLLATYPALPRLAEAVTAVARWEAVLNAGLELLNCPALIDAEDVIRENMDQVTTLLRNGLNEI